MSYTNSVDTNAAVYKYVTTHLPSSISSLWTSCLCQLRVIAKREHRKIATTTHGASLYTWIELLKRDHRAPSFASLSSHDVQHFPEILHIVNNHIDRLCLTVLSAIMSGCYSIYQLQPAIINGCYSFYQLFTCTHYARDGNNGWR